MKGRSLGFTLIEILVVIVIIAVIFAILFAAFARAREKARAASCASWVKQLGLYLAMYCADYDQRCPPAAPSAGNGREMLQPLRPNADPSRSWGPSNWRTILLPYAHSNPVYFVCPTTNTAFSYQFNPKLYGVQLAAVARPADLACIYDAGLLDGSAPPPHSGGYNVAFLDSHVTWLTSTAGVSTRP
jgi:prepilin-type N-terminal cleavage/methylation domain-containing protein/prepilin-type processing-associated H-X9-DG protein